MAYIQELRSLVGNRPLILVGTMVMIFDVYHQLLLQYRADDNLWDLPGGFMEIGETIEETARREVWEETGLVIGEITLFKICSGQEFIYKCPNGDQVVSVTPVYVTNDIRGYLQPDGREAIAAQFFPISELPNEMFPQVRHIVEEFFKSRGV